MQTYSRAKHYERRGRAIVDLAERRGRSFGDTSDDWINDAERMQRCSDAAEDGCDGSTHRERIDDMRDNVRELCNGRERMEACAMEYLSGVESWHERNGTLDEEIG